MEEEVENSLIVESFNTPLSKINRSSRKKNNEEMVILKSTLDKMDQTDI